MRSHLKDVEKLKSSRTSHLMAALIFVLPMVNIAQAQSKSPDANHYAAQADALNEASRQLSVAESCGKESSVSLPPCVLAHLRKAAQLLSPSVAESESMAVVKTGIEEFARNIERAQNPIDYQYRVFSKNAAPWFIKIDETLRFLRQKAKAFSSASKATTSGQTRADGAASGLTAPPPNSR